MIIDFDSKNNGGGKEPVVESLSVTENGIYNAPSGVDGYNPVEVNVPQKEPVVEALNVTANGSYTPKSGVDGFTPVNVNVPQREPVLEALSVTDNGTYTPSVGKDGFDSVDVNVPKEIHNVTSKSITANGVYNSTGDEVWNEVSVNVPQSGGTVFDFNQLYGVQLRTNGATIDLTGLDTSTFTSMKSMFSNCSSLKSLDLSHLDTSNVTDISAMFDGCKNITSLDLSHFDTSKLTSMTGMFYNCMSLTSLNISNFNMSACESVSSMFGVCWSLTTIISDGLQLPDIDLSNIMLDWCPLTVDSIVGLLNALPTTTDGYSFQIGQTNIDKLSDDQKAIATNKGWTLV